MCVAQSRKLTSKPSLATALDLTLGNLLNDSMLHFRNRDL